MTQTFEINWAITPAIVQALLTYEPETGDFTWKSRARHWFRREADWKTWNKRFAGKPALAAKDSQGYRHGQILGRPIKAHRAAHAFMLGEWPPDQIDHIDQDRSNNRWSNLRAVSRSENLKNTKLPTRNTTGAIGVSFRKDLGKFQAKIRIDGKNRSVGTYPDVATAAAAYRFMARRSGFSERHGTGGIVGDTGALPEETLVDLRSILNPPGDGERDE